MDETGSIEDVDVAIVGGGPAGCYLAWRLARGDLAGTPLAALAAARPGGALKVRLYELDARVGGRIETVRLPELPDVPVELGAIAFAEPPIVPAGHAPQYGGHVHVAALLRALEAEAARPEVFSVSPIAGSEPATPFFMRGTHFVAAQLGSAGVMPYDLSAEELASVQTPAGLFGLACERALPGATQLPETAWAEVGRTATWRGRPLHEYAIGEVLRATLSPDACAFVWDTAADPGMFTVLNAADAMALVLCHEVAPLNALRLDAGYQVVPDALRDGFVARVPEGFRPGHRLASVEPAPEGAATLRFETDAGAVTVRARHTVLALPRVALERLAASPLFQGDAARQFHADLRAVEAYPMFRHFASYPVPWWRRANVSGGPGATTLPIRLAYAFETQGERPGAPDPRDATSLFLVSFRPDEAAPPGHDAQDDLRQLYQLDAIPAPIREVKKHWRGGASGGAWHGWRAGARSWEVARRMVRPIAGTNVHVCGEAYSQVQGWVEGALRSCAGLLALEWSLPFLPEA
jgi:monoamine oxidase